MDRIVTVSRAWWCAVALLAVACSPRPAGQVPPSPSAAAELRDVLGQAAGTAELTARGSDSTAVVVRVGASVSARGVHLHGVGQCDAPNSFAGAGGHLNPFAHQHGRRNPRGYHAGDLPNLPGGGVLQFTLAVPFDSVLDADGSAIVVHAIADDEMTDPSGNSGPRMLCGVFDRASGRRAAP